MKQFVGSTIISECQKRIEDDLGYSWTPDLTIDTIVDFLQSTATFLGRKQSKDQPVAMILKDLNGGFHFGAWIEFEKDENNDTDEGSWNLAFTFYEDEIDKSWKVFDWLDDAEVRTVFYDCTYESSGIAWRFKEMDANDEICQGNATQILCLIIDTIADYMRLNVTVDPVLEIKDLMTLKAEVQQDKVYISIEPTVRLRQYVKSDTKVSEE